MIGLLTAVRTGIGYYTNGDGPTPQQGIKFSSDFESGSIGNTKRLPGSELAYELSLRNDNNNPSLPDSWRTWWYARLEDVPTNEPLRLEFTRLGFPYYFVPVYSYDNKNWRHFSENEVQMSQGCRRETLPTCRLTVTKRFAEPTVWIARTFPYTTQDLSTYLNSIKSSPFVKISTLGSTAQERPIKKVTISDENSVPDSGRKKSVFINARTHPGETGSSFLLEGLINTALSNTDVGKKLRQNYIFHIVPMQNVDGVVLGNYRTTASSTNLEAAWRFNRQTPVPVPLENNVPLENKVVGEEMWQLQLSENQPVILALNLHSSNSHPNDPPFFYPHFGEDPNKYTESERNLWRTQKGFIQQVDLRYEGNIRPPIEGGKGFLKTHYPETWWWHNKNSQVNAITLETVYSKAGLDHWITPDDHRKLGKAIAESIASGSAQAPSSRVKRSSLLAWKAFQRHPNLLSRRPIGF